MQCDMNPILFAFNSRDIETEADDVGLEMAARACIDVREAPNFWAKMAAMSASDPDGAEQQPPEILSTHPAHESRDLMRSKKNRLEC